LAVIYRASTIKPDPATRAGIPANSSADRQQHHGFFVFMFRSWIDRHDNVIAGHGRLAAAARPLERGVQTL